MTSKMFAGRYYSHSARLEKIKEEQVNIREVKKWLSSEYQNCPIIFHSNPSSFSVTYQNVWNKRAFSVVDIFIEQYIRTNQFRNHYLELPHYWNILEMLGLQDAKNFINVLGFVPGIMAYFLDIDYNIHVLEAPKIRLDDESRLHSTNSAAVSWSRGELYCIHGIEFESKEFWKIVNRTMPPEMIIQLSNIEQRRIATQIYGIELLMKSLNKKLIDWSSRGNELYEIGLGKTITWVGVEFEFTGLVLKYSCPSTGRIYFSGIPEFDDNGKNIQTANQAMAWKFGLSEVEYMRLNIEA